MANKEEAQESQESQIAVLYEKYKTIEEKLDKIDKAVSGNGRPGLKERMDRIRGGLLVAYVIMIIIAGALSVSIL